MNYNNRNMLKPVHYSPKIGKNMQKDEGCGVWEHVTGESEDFAANLKYL